MKLTRQELDYILKRNPSISTETDIHNRVERICPTKQERPKRKALVNPISGENKSLSRHSIRFTIYAVRPCDWDNYWTKICQDLLAESGILHDDAWNVLQGEVISEKVYRKEEERTVIEIF